MPYKNVWYENIKNLFSNATYDELQNWIRTITKLM